MNIFGKDRSARSGRKPGGDPVATDVKIRVDLIATAQ